jgi:predicted amidohydrolase
VKFDVAVAQVKPRKGDYAYNLERIGDLFAQLEEDAPETGVLVLPETVLSGYFLEGGVRDLARSAEQVFQDLLTTYRARVTRPDAALDVCLGFYELGDGKYYNSALYCTLTASDASSIKAGIVHRHRKFFLPTYGVFDEKRFVARGRSIRAFDTRFGRVAVLICEDVWHSITSTIAALQGAQIIYVISASPGRDFNDQHAGNVARWNVLLPGIADEHNVWVVYAGLVGFEGGKGFTGSSQVIDPWGNSQVLAPVLEECLVRATVDREDVAIARAGAPLLADLESALGDLVLELEELARAPYRDSIRPESNL